MVMADLEIKVAILLPKVTMVEVDHLIIILALAAEEKELLAVIEQELEVAETAEMEAQIP
jgi:hypothetical protein